MRLFCRAACIVLGFMEISGSVPGQDAASTAGRTEKIAQEVIVRTNAERTKRGLPPLKRNANLTQAAQWLAKDMAERGYFDHTDRQGRNIGKRIPDFGYINYRMMAENIAMGQRSATEVVAGWMKSAGHRENLLNPEYREIGVGVTLPRGKSRAHWVQDFGTRQDVYPILINEEEAQTKSRAVRLYLHGKGWAEEMRLSNDGANWTEWRAFAPETTWTLPSRTGERTVFAELRRGDRTLRSEDSIELLPESR